MESIIPKEALISLNQVNNTLNYKLLFIVAGLEGNCDTFRDLSEKLEQKSIQVFGLQFNKQVPFDNITLMALFYIEIIKNELNKRNKLNFYLAGYSFGGLIAIEISRLLKKTNLVKDLLLFESSHVFFKVAAHQNFQVFKHQIVTDNFLKYPHVYKGVLSIYLLNFIGAPKLKHELYDYLTLCDSLDGSIDKSIEFLLNNSIYQFDNDNEMYLLKEFIRLLILKSAAGYIYDIKEKLSINIHLFKSKKFIYSKIIESNYNLLKNSIKFNLNNYNLNEISECVCVYEFENGNHWNFISENQEEISNQIDKIVNSLNAKL